MEHTPGNPFETITERNLLRIISILEDIEEHLDTIADAAVTYNQIHR